MRYVIIGAGAIGGAVGGLLAASGHQTLFLARGANAATIRERGLTVATPQREYNPRVPVVESIADLELTKDDALILAVKTQDTAALLPRLAVLEVGTGTAADALPIFSFQNGIRNEAECARHFRRVHGVALNMPVAYLTPGRVEAYGAPMSGILEVGRYPSGHDEDDIRIVDDLTSSGYVADIRDDVMAWKHAKLLVNLANAIEPLCGRDRAEDAEAVAAIATAARAEGKAVLAAAGLAVTDSRQLKERFGGTMQLLPINGERQGGSTWQSVAKGADTVETAYLNGEVSMLGQLTGIPTPVNDAIVRYMNLLVSGRIEPETVSAAELLETVAG